MLVEAQTGEVTDSRELPWYVTALLVSQPLHFGDYGGMPMQILWALLDVVTIIVLAAGSICGWCGAAGRDPPPAARCRSAQRPPLETNRVGNAAIAGSRCSAFR